MSMRPYARFSALVLVVAAAGAWTQAAPRKAPQTATQFYLDYRKALYNATKVEDLFPYVSSAMRKEVDKTPAADRPMMFGMMKMMAVTDLKVLKEDKPAADGSVILTAEGMSSDKQKQTGTITIVKEGGAWKLGEEKWKG